MSTNNPHRSYTDKEFLKAVKDGYGMVDVMTYLGLRPGGGNYRSIKKLLTELNPDTSHWIQTKTGPKGKRKTLEELLVKDSDYRFSSALKSRLLTEGILEYRCYTCGINKWLDQDITLQIDHINGDHLDHRIDNLRLLCPNCHSQTPTHKSKNKKGKKKKKYKMSKSLKAAVEASEKKKKYKKNNCKVCGKGITNEASKCKSCYGKEREKTKIEWPPTEELFIKVRETSYVQVAKELGVSDNAVRKRLKNHM